MLSVSTPEAPLRSTEARDFYGLRVAQLDAKTESHSAVPRAPLLCPSPPAVGESSSVGLTTPRLGGLQDCGVTDSGALNPVRQAADPHMWCTCGLDRDCDMPAAQSQTGGAGVTSGWPLSSLVAFLIHRLEPLI